MANTAVVFRGFDFGTTAEAITAHCAEVGEVVSVEFQGHKDESRCKAAVVTLASEEAAQQAVEKLNKSTIDGNTRFIDVRLWLRGEASGKKAKVSGKGEGKNMTDLANAAWEMGMMMGKKGGGKGVDKDAMEAMFQQMFSKDGGRANENNAKTWKSKLWEAFAKTHKDVQLSKDTIAFATSDAVGGVYTTTVSCEQFSSTYEGEGDSQKASVNKAAEVALRAEFPDLVGEFEKEGDSWGGKTARGSGSNGGGGMMAKMVQMMGGGAQQQQQQLPARSQLQNAYCKKFKKITKGDISYSTEQLETTQKRSAQFVSTVSSEVFATSYTGAPAVGKKAAEENAAVMAMQAEFPAEFASSSSGSWISQKNNEGEQAEVLGKRKRAGKDKAQEQKRASGPKTQLTAALRKITKERVDAGMIEYCTTEEQEMTITTVVIKCLDPEQSFTGDPVDGTTPQSKREAEESAATVAYEALKDHLDVAEAEQEIKQEAKRQKMEGGLV